MSFEVERRGSRPGVPDYEPAVPGPEGLELGGLGVLRDAEAVVAGAGAHDAVMPDPELFPSAGESDVFGRGFQDADVFLLCWFEHVQVHAVGAVQQGYPEDLFLSSVIVGLRTFFPRVFLQGTDHHRSFR